MSVVYGLKNTVMQMKSIFLMIYKFEGLTFTKDKSWSVDILLLRPQNVKNFPTLLYMSSVSSYTKSLSKHWKLSQIGVLYSLSNSQLNSKSSPSHRLAFIVPKSMLHSLNLHQITSESAPRVECVEPSIVHLSHVHHRNEAEDHSNFQSMQHRNTTQN